MVGKRVRDAVYVHRSAVDALTAPQRDSLACALELCGEADWNVARLEPQAVGLLHYPDFERDPFPALAASTRVELSTERVTRRSFDVSGNPLILHRKEQLVAPNHPQAPLWRDLTRALAARGLFRDPQLIGRRQAWAQRLAEAGVRVEGHMLCPS